MPWLLRVAATAWLAAMLALASPRATGDASEYVAMAANLADLRPPALTREEMQAFTERQGREPGGFELETRQLPELLGADGRQDMPHMWMYSLLAVPGVWLSRSVGVGDAWGPVALNVLLLALLLVAAARRSCGPWTLLLFAGPFVWWLDKPMADLFIACALGLAVLAWPTHGPAALAVLGLAAAQNPALGAVWLGWATVAVLQDPHRLRQPAWIVGALTGALLASTSPLYYLWHLGRLSPLTTYTTMHWPSLTSLLFPVSDVNMGALSRFTPGVVAVAFAVTRPAGWRLPSATPALVTVILLLAITSQQPNRNNGGHPDLSRYVLWLWPLALPWLQAADRAGRRWHHLGVVLLLATAAWSSWQFRPTLPERYRYPTPLAEWLWREHPAWTAPVPESFAERVSHREPGWVPVATAACEKVLLYEGAWPWACPPPADPPEQCRADATFCYANARGDGTYGFVVIGPAPGVGVAVTAHRWTAADEVTRWLARATAGARAIDQQAAAVSVRSSAHLARLQVWSTADGRVLMHAHDVGDRARLALRHAAPIRVRIARPDGPAIEQTWTASADPTIVPLPTGRHLFIEVRPVSVR